MIRPPPSNLSYIIQIRNLYGLRDLDREVGIDHTDHLSEMYNLKRWGKAGGWGIMFALLLRCGPVLANTVWSRLPHSHPSVFVHTVFRFSGVTLVFGHTQIFQLPMLTLFATLSLCLHTTQSRLLHHPHLRSHTPQMYCTVLSMGSNTRRSSSCFYRSFRARPTTRSSS